MKKKFQPGDKLMYKGSGFRGFKSDTPEMKFVRYEGNFSCYVLYDGLKVLVYVSDIEKTDD
jgi:hypothetical protein